MKRTLTGLILIALFAPQMAQAKDRDEDAAYYRVSSAEAAAIALANGVISIREQERDDGLWEIEGYDADGREVEIEIHGQSGEVVKYEVEGHHDSDDDSGHHSGDHH